MTSAQDPATSEAYLSPAETRDRLRISRRTLQRWVADGKLHAAARLPNGHKRFAAADVEALLSREVHTP